MHRQLNWNLRTDHLKKERNFRRFRCEPHPQFRKTLSSDGRATTGGYRLPSLKVGHLLPSPPFTKTLSQARLRCTLRLQTLPLAQLATQYQMVIGMGTIISEPGSCTNSMVLISPDHEKHPLFHKCIIRAMPITDSVSCRSVIRDMPLACSGAWRSACPVWMIGITRFYGSISPEYTSKPFVFYQPANMHKVNGSEPKNFFKSG